MAPPHPSPHPKPFSPPKRFTAKNVSFHSSHTAANSSRASNSQSPKAQKKRPSPSEPPQKPSRHYKSPILLKVSKLNEAGVIQENANHSEAMLIPPRRNRARTPAGSSKRHKLQHDNGSRAAPHFRALSPQHVNRKVPPHHRMNGSLRRDAPTTGDLSSPQSSKRKRRFLTPQPSNHRRKRSAPLGRPISQTPPPTLHRRASISSSSTATGLATKPFLSSGLSLKSFVLMENLLSEKLKLNQLVCKYKGKVAEKQKKLNAELDGSKEELATGGDEQVPSTSSTSPVKGRARNNSTTSSEPSNIAAASANLEETLNSLKKSQNLSGNSPTHGASTKPEEEHNFNTASNMTTHLLYILYIVVFLQRVEGIPVQVYCEIYNYMLQGEFWARNIASDEEMQRFVVSFVQRMSLEAFECIGMTAAPNQEDTASRSSSVEHSKQSSAQNFDLGTSTDLSSTNNLSTQDILQRLDFFVKNDHIYNEIITEKLDVVVPIVAIAFLWIWTKREQDARSLLRILLDRKKAYGYRIPKREIAWMYYLIGESYVQQLYRTESANQEAPTPTASPDDLDELRRQALFWFDRSVTLSKETCWLALTRRAVLRMADEPKAALRDLTKSISLAPYHAENFIHRATLLATEPPQSTALRDNSNVSAITNTSDGEGTIPYDIDRAIHDLTAVVLMKGNYLYDALTQRSQLLLQKEKRKAALRDLTMAIQTFPKKSTAYYQRAMILKDKSPQQAIIDLTIALSIHPKPEYYFQRAAASVQLGRFSDALSDYTASIRISKSAMALFKRANLLERLRKYDHAIKDLSEAIKFDSTQAKYHARRALIYFKNKRAYKLALKDFNETIARDKINPQHYNNRGLVHVSLKQFGKALEDFNSALDLHPEYAAAYMNRAKLYLRTAKYNAALKDMDAACVHEPANDYYRFSKAGLYSFNNKQDEQETIFVYSKALALKDINEAIKISEKKRQPNAQYHARRAAFLKQDHVDKCIEDLSRAIELTARQGDAKISEAAEYFSQRSLAFESKKAFHDALQDLNHAIDLNSQKASYYVHRAALYMKHGEKIARMEHEKQREAASSERIEQRAEQRPIELRVREFLDLAKKDAQRAHQLSRIG